MNVEVARLKTELLTLTIQRDQAKDVFHQASGAILVLNNLIKEASKVPDVENENVSVADNSISEESDCVDCVENGG